MRGLEDHRLSDEEWLCLAIPVLVSFSGPEIDDQGASVAFAHRFSWGNGWNLRFLRDLW